MAALRPARNGSPAQTPGPAEICTSNAALFSAASTFEREGREACSGSRLAGSVANRLRGSCHVSRISDRWTVPAPTPSAATICRSVWGVTNFHWRSLTVPKRGELVLESSQLGHQTGNSG